MISAWIASAAWRRFDVTELVLKQRQRLCVELAARGVQATSLIVANDENLEIARAYGCETLEAANEPLGRKCNLGLRYAAERADWVIWVGSDDWIHPDAFGPLLADVDRSVSIIHGATLAMVDLASGQLQRINSASKYGAIPWLIDSRLIAPTNRRDLIRPDLPRGLDGALIRGLRLTKIPFQFELHQSHDFRCVDFKTTANLSSYEGVARNLGIADAEPAWDALAGWFPDDLIEEARAVSAAHL